MNADLSSDSDVPAKRKTTATPTSSDYTSSDSELFASKKNQLSDVSDDLKCIHCELSRLRCHGHSLLLSSYLNRISRKQNSACSACGHPLQDLNHLLLDCPASEPLRKSIFGSSLSILDLWSRPWGVARLLISAEFLRALIPRKGSGSTTTTT